MTRSAAFGHAATPHTTRSRRSAPISRGLDNVYISRRLLKVERKAFAGLAALAHQEVAHLLKLRASDPAWMAQYDRVQGFHGPRLIEVDVGGGHRMIAHPGDNNEVTFLGLGPHGWFTRYTARMLADDLAGREPLPRRFRPAPGPVLLSSGDSRLIPYANEAEPEWLYFLDEEQAGIAESIVDTIEDGLLGGAETAQLLVGGPGTGKTTILMQVLAHLSGLFADSIETWDVRLAIGDELARYITASTSWDLTAARRPVTLDDPADVLLVDDPSTIWEMKEAKASLTAGSARALVLAFDHYSSATASMTTGTPNCATGSTRASAFVLLSPEGCGG